MKFVLWPIRSVPVPDREDQVQDNIPVAKHEHAICKYCLSYCCCTNLSNKPSSHTLVLKRWRSCKWSCVWRGLWAYVTERLIYNGRLMVASCCHVGWRVHCWGCRVGWGLLPLVGVRRRWRGDIIIRSILCLFGCEEFCCVGHSAENWDKDKT